MISLQSGDEKDAAPSEEIIDDSDKKRPRERKDTKQRIKRSKPIEKDQVDFLFVTHSRQTVFTD